MNHIKHTYCRRGSTLPLFPVGNLRYSSSFSAVESSLTWSRILITACLESGLENNIFLHSLMGIRYQRTEHVDRHSQRLKSYVACSIWMPVPDGIFNNLFDLACFAVKAIGVVLVQRAICVLWLLVFVTVGWINDAIVSGGQSFVGSVTWIVVTALVTSALLHLSSITAVPDTTRLSSLSQTVRQLGFDHIWRNTSHRGPFLWSCPIHLSELDFRWQFNPTPIRSKPTILSCRSAGQLVTVCAKDAKKGKDDQYGCRIRIQFSASNIILWNLAILVYDLWKYRVSISILND